MAARTCGDPAPEMLESGGMGLGSRFGILMLAAITVPAMAGDDRLRSKSIRGLHSGLEDPFFDTILDWNRRFSIRKGNIMPSLLQPLAEVQRWISRTGPLPVAEKVKDFHSIANPTRFSRCFRSRRDSDGPALKEKVIILDSFKFIDVFCGTNKLL